MKEEKIDEWRIPFSLIPNRGNIKTFPCSDGEKTPNMAELWCHPSWGGCFGARVVGKGGSSRQTGLFSSSQRLKKEEERIVWWEGPLLTLPGQLNVNHVRDKNDFWMSSLKGISGSSVASTSFSVFCLFVSYWKSPAVLPCLFSWNTLFWAIDPVQK